MGLFDFLRRRTAARAPAPEEQHVIENIPALLLATQQASLVLRMKTRTILIAVFCASIALFVAAIASCAGVLFFTYRNVDTSISPTIDELFTAMQDDTFVDTYETHTASELKQAVTREQYEQLGRTIKTRLGPLKSKTMRQFNVRQQNANQLADVVYAGTFEHGAGTITARFKKQGDQWLVVNLNVNSPEFQKDLATATCPHCGAPHSADARFCPKCGKPLTADDAGTPPSEQKPEDER